MARKHIHMRRLSDCVGSSEGAVVSTTSLVVWWFQLHGWNPTYCQQGPQGYQLVENRYLL